MQRRSGLWLILLLALALAGLAAWYLVPGDKVPDSPAGPVVRVESGTMRKLVVSTGTVKPQVGAQVKVGARVSGRVEKLLVGVGQEVKAGQVVAVIEHKDLQAKLDQAEAELAAAQGKLERVEQIGPREVALARADIAEVQARLAKASLDLGRQRELHREELVARDAMEQAGREVSVLEAQLAAAKARLARAESGFNQDRKVAQAEVEAARARLVTARINLGYATVRATISGVVSSVSTQEGETVAASLNSPTFITIVDLGRLEVENYVDETDVGQVKVGQKAFFTVDAYPDRRFRGRVQAIHPTAQIIDNVVYYPVVIQVDDDYQGLLKPEMTANVSIVVAAKKDALWIPSRAVKREKGKSYVMLPGPDGPRRQEVKLGWSEGDKVEIVKGLADGQEIIAPAGPGLGPLSGKSGRR